MYLDEVADLLRQRAEEIRLGYEGGSAVKYEDAAKTVDETIELLTALVDWWEDLMMTEGRI